MAARPIEAALAILLLSVQIGSAVSGAETAGNETAMGNNGSHNTESHGIAVASWKYDFVRFPLIITAFILAVTILKICYHHMHAISRIVPESCVLILLGIGLGALFLLDPDGGSYRFLIFDHSVFFLLLLPPIILEASYSLRDRAFIENIGTILLFAVVGTILNICLMGTALCVLKAFGVFGSMEISILGILVFSSLIAAVDPVAVLAIFQEIGVNKMLYFMVFGESLLNDAVTVVMYNLMLEFKELPTITLSDILLGLIAFLCVAFGAVMIGSICGFASSYLTKFTNEIRVTEPIILFGMAYLSYLLAELFHFSGIISIICCGIIQMQYAAENISSKSYITVHYFSKVASSVTEALIFIILGVMLVNNHEFIYGWSTSFSISSLVLCVVVRFLVVYALTHFVNHAFMGPRKITSHEQFIVAYGGLRGAVSYSLAFMLSNHEVPAKDTLLGATYLIIFFTVFFQGITMKPLVRLLRIRLVNKDANKDYRLFHEFDRALVYNVMVGVEEIIGQHGMYYWTAAIKWLNQRYIRPAVQRQYQLTSTPSHGLVTTFQEMNVTHDLDRQLAKSSIGHSAVWQNLQALDSAKLPVSISDAMLDAQDKSGRKSIRERARAPKMSVSVDDAEGILRLRNAVMNPLHRRVHYVRDRNLTQDAVQRLGSFEHLARVRHAYHQKQPASATASSLLHASLLPMAASIHLDRPLLETSDDEEYEDAV